MKSSLLLTLFCLVSLVCLLAGCEVDEINAPTSPCNGLTSITDIDGNIYEVVEIGSQCWMKENLRTTHYRDSTVILERSYLPPEQFYDNVYLDAWYWAKSDHSEDSIYGKLYTWAAVNSSHGICPIGWHAPSQSEFDTLIEYLGGDSLAEPSLRANYLWNVLINGATNTSRFSAVPAGRVSPYGNFMLGFYAVFWSTREISFDIALQFGIDDNKGNQLISSMHKTIGNSCRCVRDSI